MQLQKGWFESSKLHSSSDVNRSFDLQTENTGAIFIDALPVKGGKILSYIT